MRKASKKQNRRLKRTVRRTIGALCLISAITIAAIPVPENMAYNPSENTIVSYNDIRSTEDSGKTIRQAADGEDLLSPSDLPKEGLTYSISSAGNNKLILDWQFKYKADSSLSNGYITGFNSNYSKVDTLVVDDVLYSDYVYFYIDELGDDFFDTVEYDESKKADYTKNITVHLGDKTETKTVNKLGVIYTLSGNPFNVENDPTSGVKEAFSSKDEYKFMRDNFPSDLEKYISDYKLYVENKVSTPPVLRKSLIDLEKYNNIDKQHQYVCEQLLSSTTGIKMTINAVKMYVYDAGSRSEKDVYLFKLLDYSADSQVDFGTGKLFYTDKNSFLTHGLIRIVGFAENSLQGVANIHQASIS